LGRREQGVTEKDRELERKAFLRLGCECNNIKHSIDTKTKEKTEK